MDLIFVNNSRFFNSLIARWVAGPAFAVALLLLSVVTGMGEAQAAVEQGSVVASGLHVTSSGKLTQVQVDLSGQVIFDVRASGDSRSVTIKANGLDFSLPTGAGRIAKGLVRRIRYGKMPDGHSEISIDLSRPAIIQKSYLALAKGAKKAKMTIVLAQAEEAGTELSSPEVTGSLPAATARAAPRPDGSKRVIVIDPGHGGIDPGAISPAGIKEKDVVLSFATQLKSALEATGAFDVIMTRDDDQFKTLQSRVDVARASRADLFIAIHADKINNRSVRGTTLYLLSDTASDAEAEALAQKENRADAIAGVNLQEQSSTVADVLVDLAQRESRNRAAMFAENAVGQLKPATQFTGQAVRSAGFVVLKAPDVPSVLIELGYLSNAEDAAHLDDAAWRGRVAQSLAAAVSSQFSHSQPAEQSAQASP